LNLQRLLGGYPKFVSQGFNEAWLPIWLQDIGYNTYYTGKLFNAHSLTTYNLPFVNGFTGSDFLLDPHTYEYLNASFQRNRDAPVSHEGEYSTDVLAKKAYGFLEDAVAEQKPFFLTIAPNAPHSNVRFQEGWFNGSGSAHNIITTPPIPADRHKGLFQDAVVPRTPGFNPDEVSLSVVGVTQLIPEQPHGVSWISELPQQTQANVDFNDGFYRDRLRALQAVDEIVDGVIARLTQYDILDSTYIFYSSDNGYHIGQHRLQPGKECGFEEDINVPLIVRGPGVAKGKVSDIVTSHTDLAPTFLSLTGGEIRSDFDGVAIPVASDQIDAAANVRGEHVNIEYWGFALAEGQYGKAMHWNNTYKGLRLIGDNYNLYYSVWCSGEHELYDLVVSASVSASLRCPH
jgi:arylsulfatase A-like enzyme